MFAAMSSHVMSLRRLAHWLAPFASIATTALKIVSKIASGVFKASAS